MIDGGDKRATAVHVRLYLQAMSRVAWSKNPTKIDNSQKHRITWCTE